MTVAPDDSIPTRPGVAAFAAAVARAAQADAMAPLGHVLTIQQQLEAIAAGNFDAVLEQAHPDIELELVVPPHFAFITRAKGVANVRQAIAHNFLSVENQQPAVTRVVTQDEVVVLFGTERGTLRASGLPYHVEFVERFTFEAHALRAVKILAVELS
jgi:ketosteroid isomerase-like protein